MADLIEGNPNAEIRAAYKPSEKEHGLLRFVYQRYSDMKATRSKFEPIWDRHEKQWEAWRPPKNINDWQSNIVPPFTTSIVEAELSELIDQTLRPKASARGPEDKPKATVINHVMEYTWEVGDGDIELYKAIKDALVLGTGIVQEYYWKDARQVRVLVKYDPEKGVEEYEEKEINDFDDVYMEAVKLQDFFIDESARSINRGPYKANDCIRRYILDFEKFKTVYKGKIFDPLDNAKYVKPGGDTNYYEFYQPPKGINQKEIEVLWYWSRNPDKLVITANDVVLRNSPNPYNHKQLPFAQALDVMRPHQFYHKGEPELLESIQDELTTIRRQRIDRSHLDIDKVFLVSNREVLTDQDLITAPHKPIYVDDPMGSIKPLEYSATPQSAYLEEDRLKEDGERVTGMDVRSQSVRASGSATEAAILKEATLRRLRLKIWLLSRTLLMEQSRLRVANIIQHYSQPKLQSILGAKEPELANAIAAGNVRSINGQQFIEQPRTIRTTNIELTRVGEGGIEERDNKGENFFDVLPEDVIPIKGAFDLKLSAEPTFPVSKPLLQQKVNELFQHPIIQAAVQQGLLDLKKTASKMLEINDFDPDDFEVREEPEAAIDPEQMIRMAMTENEQMMEGDEMPGTPFATSDHTEIHLNFMGSEDFKKAFRTNPGIVNLFVRHILFEEAAQQERQNQPAGQPGTPTPPGGAGSTAGGVGASEAAAANAPRAVGETGMTEGIAG